MISRPSSIIYFKILYFILIKKSYLLLHIAVVLAGFTGVFGKLISLNEVVLVWYRVFIPAILLFALVRFTKKTILNTLSERVKLGKVSLLIGIHWIFFYASIKYSNISVGVICYCLTSLFTAIFEPLINKKPFSAKQLSLSALTLVGIILIFHLDPSFQLGIILGVISAAFAALYTVYNERLVKHYDSVVINYYQMVAATIGLSFIVPAYLYFSPAISLVPDLADFLNLIFLAAVCTVFLYVLFAESLKSIPAFTVNLSFNLEPIYSIILAFIFFGEGKEVNIYFYVGCAFVLSSVLSQSLRTNNNMVPIELKEG
ncbi:DMT family transporter [Pedobacter sp. AW1-32]|uniref:DMT family transporter n=1 Tax=Pedobacter sp. AW1-32 TaxID=3383026 RepID=UPI003FEE8333